MPQLEHITAIEKRLWSAADTLRANSTYASNEYYMPVMGLVFLRHAYSRYLNVKDEIVAGLPSRGGKTRALKKEDFSEKSAIFLQEKAQFDHLADCPCTRSRSWHQHGSCLRVRRHVCNDPNEKPSLEETVSELSRKPPVQLRRLTTSQLQRSGENTSDAVPCLLNEPYP